MREENQEHCLHGLVTDADLNLAEEEFPGISQLFLARGRCDRTFLDLLAAYLGVTHAAA